MSTHWRLLLDGAGSGPWNMGVDEVLLESAVARGTGALRLYRWDGPWLSLGYGQSLAPLRRAACAEAGVGVVRRVTGGRAVLHGGDLTYAIAAPDRMLPDGLVATYQLIAQALADALRALGVEATRAPRPPTPSRGAPDFDCFAAPAGDELCARGHKLVGSAQRRTRGAVLQHGSIRVHPDPAAAREAAGIGGLAATSLAELDVPCSYGDLCDACVTAFERSLSAVFAPEPLSDRERQAAAARCDGLEDGFGASASFPRGASRAHLDGR